MAKIDFGQKLRHVRRIRSHVGYGDWLRNHPNMIGLIIRQADIPSPYRYSPDHTVYSGGRDGPCIVVETSHRCYDVFAVPADMPLMPMDDDNG